MLNCMQVNLLQQWVFVTGTDWLCVLCVWSYSDKRQQQYTQHCGCGDRSSGALMLKRENSTTPPREFCPGNIYQPADSHSGSRAREKLLCLWLFLQTLNLSSVVANLLLAASESLCLCACFVYPLFDQPKINTRQISASWRVPSLSAVMISSCCIAMF